MKTAVLYGASARRNLIELRRYFFDTLSGVLTIYGFFVVIFFFAHLLAAGRPGFGHTISGIVVWYALWALTVFSLGSLTFEITQEAQQGTLEQLGMSPFGLPRVLVARVFTYVSIYFVMWVFLLVVMMATTGRWLNIDVVSLLPILVVTMIGAIGLGFVLAGMAIVFKRVQNAMQVYQVMIIGLILAPAGEVLAFRFVPLAWGSYLLRRVMVDHVSIFSMPVGYLLLLVANSAFYFFGGIAVFKVFERMARQRGLLGHY